MGKQTTKRYVVMNVASDIRFAKVFVAVVADSSELNNKQRVRQYELVRDVGTPMYAIIKSGVGWDGIKHLPWKKVYYAKSPQEVPAFLDMIDYEVRGGLFNT